MHISPRIECVGHAPRPHRAGCATHMCGDREEGRKARAERGGLNVTVTYAYGNEHNIA